jgi:hypothetical protein
MSILILACVQIPIRREKLLQTQQRLEGNSWLFSLTQRRAASSVEHPRRNPKTVASVIFRKMTAKDGLARASKLAAHDKLLSEQRMPPILHAAATGFLVSVSSASRSMARSMLGAATPMRAAIESSAASATACCGWRRSSCSVLRELPVALARIREALELPR